jgi:hypothetical protein
MIMGSKWQRYKINNQKPEVYVGLEPVPLVPQAKNLGLIMDGELRFEQHVNTKLRNAFYRLKMLYGLRKYLSEKVREILVEALVLSPFNYTDIVYGPRLLGRTAKAIQRVQNACTRFCYSINRRDHITPHLNNRSILNMKNRRNLHLAFALRKIIEYQRPPYLFEKLKWAQEERVRLVRSHRQNLLTIPKHKTKFFRGGFKYAATKIWNDLPPPLRDPMPLLKFKKLVKAHFLESQKMNHPNN